MVASAMPRNVAELGCLSQHLSFKCPGMDQNKKPVEVVVMFYNYSGMLCIPMRPEGSDLWICNSRNPWLLSIQ